MIKKNILVIFVLFLILGLFCFLFFVFSNKPIIDKHISSKELSSSLDKGMIFLYETQLASGEFLTKDCSDTVMTNCSNYSKISSPFLTTFVIYSIKDIRNEKTKIIINRSLSFLSSQEINGTWSFLSKSNPDYLTPDVDTIATISFSLNYFNRSFAQNKHLIYANKDKEGFYLTWLSNSANSNDFDCVVNVNVLLYLKENDELICDFVNDFIVHGGSCSIYYPNNLAFFYMVSRANTNKVTCFDREKDALILNTKSYQKKDGSFGSDLDTALALNVLLDHQICDTSVKKGVLVLLKHQSRFGSWLEYGFFKSYENSFGGSKELTTAFALEAINKYVQVCGE